MPEPAPASIALIGCPYVSLRRYGAAAVRVEPKEVLRTGVDRFELVVVGSDLLRTFSPERGISLLRLRPERTVLCMATCNRATLEVFALWVQAGFPHVPSDRIEDEVERRLGRGARPVLTLAQWLPKVPAPGTRGFQAVSVVERLPRLDATHCWSHLGWKRDRLLRVCKRDLGMTAEQALQRYRLVAFDDMVSRGRTVAECVEALGGFDEQTFLRSIDRARRAQQLF